MKFRPITEVRSAMAGSFRKIVSACCTASPARADRRAFRKLNHHEECALIVLGQEARRSDPGQADDARRPPRPP